ncbi:hypothetical protein L1765_06065 [Microaerobacter geothermalis]|uniref:hypothetical protein n=1 Tax=Microaerobacter geothermalis TaxID=674972 RepID=UPI001F253729|nr:hypothetical protein [Microaerobacter geothermalis]MCF6093551.1 hypothetical protein [Microaerobacter geothermalis]
MMNLQDTLFNWLQIKVVADYRPNDKAAKETESFFRGILEEDHQVNELKVSRDDTMYHIHYVVNGKKKLQMFPKEMIDVLLEQINGEPRYGE